MHEGKMQVMHTCMTGYRIRSGFCLLLLQEKIRGLLYSCYFNKSIRAVSQYNLDLKVLGLLPEIFLLRICSKEVKSAEM